MHRTRLGRALGIAVALVCALAAVAIADSLTDGEIGPTLNMTGNGRLLHPAGRLTTLGNFPTGAALTPDGRFLWVVDAGHGQDDVKVVNVATGAVTQTLALPGGYVGVAFAPDGRHAYVSGEPRGDKSTPLEGPVKGESGDVIHVYAVSPADGSATEQDPIALPKSSGGTAKHSSLSSPVTDSWPEGLAVSPDGHWLVVALNQSDQAAIVDLTAGSSSVKTVNVGAYPYGVAISPDSKTAYVSNEYSGTVSFIDIAGASETGTVGVGGQLGDQNAHPEGMVVDAARGQLYVAVANRDLIAAIDTSKRTLTRYVSVARPEAVGTEPTSLALAPDGRTLYAADSNEDAVAAISLVARPQAGPTKLYVRVRGTKSIRRFLALAARARRTARSSKAYAKALRKLQARYLYGSLVKGCAGPSRRADRAWVRAALSAEARRARDLARARRAHSKASRVKLVKRASKRYAAAIAKARGKLPLLSRCAGDIAGLPAFTLIGRIPTAAYPTAVAVTPDNSKLLWVAGKGLGAGPNTDYRFDGAPSTRQPPPNKFGTYVLDKLAGRLGVLARPSDTTARGMTAVADAQVRPSDLIAAPAGTPVIGPGGGASEKIKHVFYVVRENRTYDQVLGTDPRGDGDPNLELFDGNASQGAHAPVAGVTPNAHALAQKFPLLDHFYADSEVSVDGHVITGSAYAIDYVQKSQAANYSGRGRPFDFGLFPVTFPPKDFVFDQAASQGVTFRNYGEAAAGNSGPTANDGRPTYAQVQANTDASYPNNALIGCLAAQNVPAPVAGAVNQPSCGHDSGVSVAGTTGFASGTSRMDVFNTQFQQQVASGTVPTFNYLILPNDHTNGTTPGGYTPRALIADNDLALGQLVQTISHSSIWADSAIFVVEDDSQDGADHVDAHRMPAFVISPWAVKGVVHTRYDQYSALRTAMMIAGLHPLSLNDALATPMYDAFTTGGTPDTAGTVFDAIQPDQSLTETNSGSSPAAAASAKLPFNKLDMVPQRVMDRILWKSVYGASSTPPAPGPNPSPAEAARGEGALRVLRRGGNVRRWLARNTHGDG
ncbi:MAG: hypothetical protein QOJ12_1844 [Thermoleophilales bacterium]|nr:hypothetical protein [Thermoleophilales bacterium]